MNQANASPVPVPDPLGVAEAATQGAVQDPGRIGLLSVATQASMDVTEHQDNSSSEGRDESVNKTAGSRASSSQVEGPSRGESESGHSETETEGSEDRCVVRSVRGEETSIL